MQKTFITCAVTGAGDGPKKSPHVPVTPKQIADSVIEVGNAGAAIAHIHVRDPETGEGSRQDELYAEVVERVRQRDNDIILNLTAGMGGDAEFGVTNPREFGSMTDLVGPHERLTHVCSLKPDICTLDCGSYNVGDENIVYISTSDYVRLGAKAIRQLGVRPELEVFDLGHLRYVLKLMGEGIIEKPALIQFSLGVPYGAPADTGALKAMVDMAVGADVIWSAFGVGRDQMRMVAQSVLLGGNVRVGLEDNLYLRKGEFATNGQLVERAASIIEHLGSSVMTPEETRQLLGLVLYDAKSMSDSRIASDV
ncbi:MAG: 3-keto-5-aminohexanoate cleavage protein [Gammaproteobacteria bacterium]|nr:3-keto-5-aminohexanoate cleavage protein [Gammaproteobacteria bacterium]